MKIHVQAKTGMREEKVEMVDKNYYKVGVKARPIDGAANEAIRRVLAEHFGVTPNSVLITTGHNSPIKIIEIAE